MNKLLELINKTVCVKRDTVNSRLAEFKKERTKNELFSELAFCILTANFNAERAIKIQKELGVGFITLPENELAKKLKELGHRHPNVRAKYIVEARKQINELASRIKNSKEHEFREWLVDNIKGLGYKEASHFMRNVGFDDVAIIDFHIIDLLEREGVIKRPKTLSKKNYLQIEEKLREISAKAGIPLSGLDLYLWCIETGKILK